MFGETKVDWMLKTFTAVNLNFCSLISPGVITEQALWCFLTFERGTSNKGLLLIISEITLVPVSICHTNSVLCIGIHKVQLPSALPDDWHQLQFLFNLQVGCILQACSVSCLSFAKIIGMTSPESSSPRSIQRNVSACFTCMVCTLFVCVCLSVAEWGSEDYQSHFDLQADCTQMSWVQIAVAIAIVTVNLWEYQGETFKQMLLGIIWVGWLNGRSDINKYSQVTCLFFYMSYLSKSELKKILLNLALKI